MSTQLVPELDVARLRQDFPILARTIHGKPLAYLDSAASAQKPRQVLDAERAFLEHSYANVHRGVYTLAAEATDAYERARDTMVGRLGAASRREVVFTRGVTEALNLLAYSWGLDNLGAGDVVVVTELEHHANLVPWQQIAARTGATLAAIPIDGAGELDLSALDRIAASGNVRVVALGYVSNTLGTVNPVEELCDWARRQGAISVVDAAQAVPHRRIDVQALGCDALAFTGHKALGPTGIGVLWARAALLDSLQPFLFGGEMIRTVTLERTTWNDLPHKFEAGTPPISQAIGLARALEYLDACGLDAIERHEHELTAYALERLAELPGVRVLGPPLERRAGIVSFEVDGVHPHDVAQILDLEGVAVRGGNHCTQPLMHALGIVATTRASFYLYNLRSEVDRLVDGLHRVRATFA